MLWPAISHHVDSNFLALLSVACAALWLDKRKDIFLFAAGALAGATTCFLQPKGVLLLLALLLCFLSHGARGQLLLHGQAR
jgi:4-amino-4-deoxy-L-arabinose transferase-like glycosyltransferase